MQARHSVVALSSLVTALTCLMVLSAMVICSRYLRSRTSVTAMSSTGSAVTVEIQEEVLCRGFWANAQDLSLTDRLQHASKLFWLHIPRKGTTFGLCILHHTFFCPTFHHKVVGTQQHHTQRYIRFKHPCPNTLDASLAEHRPLPWALYRIHRLDNGSAVTMFRKPAVHAMSLAIAYCGYDRDCYRRRAGAFSLVPLLQLRRNEGLYYTDGEDKLARRAAMLTAADLSKGIAALREFAFVGVLEEWPLSVCLFHSIFGGNFSQEQFTNGRPGKLARKGQSYNTSWVEDVIPDWSTQLYEFAQKRFHFDLQRYAVTKDSCNNSLQAFNLTAHW